CSETTSAARASLFLMVGYRISVTTSSVFAAPAAESSARRAVRAGRTNPDPEDIRLALGRTVPSRAPARRAGPRATHVQPIDPWRQLCRIDISRHEAVLRRRQARDRRHLAGGTGIVQSRERHVVSLAC